jgi:hypothetical protein
MRGDVLKTISSAKDVANAIVLTHNIDFVFIQTVALAAFRRCGHPTITIFADAACAAESFAHQLPVLTGLGVRYRVVPVAMEPGFRFHPKAVLLSGEESATLLVGSGNLTFGGWRENAEVWLRFDSEQDGTAPFHAFKGYLTEILARVPLPDAVTAEVEEAFDPKGKPWAAAEPAGDARLLGRAGSGTSLLDRMLDAVGRDPVDELLVCAPYFDDDGVGLRELVTRTGAKRTTVLCQPARSTLTRRSWEPSAGQAVLEQADFTRTNASGEERSAFIHAKLYAFRRAHEVVVSAGSANCSRAALIIPGRAGNAELQGIRTVTPAEFEEEFLGELKVTSEPVALRDEPVPDPDDGSSAGPALRVLAARFEARSLLVAYSPPGAAIVECLIDEVATRFTAVEKGVLRATSGVEPRVVVIHARVEGEFVESAPAWVDHEHYLRATARGRSLADSIRARIQPGEWNASGWAEVLDVFCKHLSYMPAHRAGGTATRGATDDEPPSEVEFTAADVFSPDYRAPTLGSIRIPAVLGAGGHVQSLQQLLLRWFGIATEEPDGEGSGGTDEGGDDTDDTVDRPEQLKAATPSTPPPAAEVSDRDRRRIEALLSQLEEAMTNAEFLAERGPDYLAADLKVASALLRLGLREGWVEHERFFDLTQKVWSSLFFSSEPQKEVGWLEHRASTAEDRESFVNDMRSAELSAALIGWKLGAPSDDATPEAARLALAAVLAVARLPWLWHGGEPEKIAEELAVLLSHTADPGVNRDTLLRQSEAEWVLLLRRGQALRLLEDAVSRLTPAEVRDRIRSTELRPGDLLWQGTAGFCVVRQRASRTADDKVTVLRLQGAGGEGQFKASFMVPMRALLGEDVVPHSDAFGDEPRQVLREFIDSLSTGFAR